jgi:ubiquinone/menaquinone biosynthesis C-methylase UbiE
MNDATATGQFNDGAAYERLMGRWSRKAGAQFLDWLNVPSGKSWLDVGCGNGAFTEEIFARAAPASVTGIDPAPGLIAYAKTRQGTERAEFLTGDALNLPFADAGFDTAVMALVIAFVPNPAQAAAEMRRVVRPGGLAATYMWDLPNGGVHLAPFYRALKDMGKPGPMPPNAEVSRLDALTELWRGAGLREVEGKVIRISVHFDDFDDFWESNTLPIGPQAERLKTMGAEEISELKERLRAALPFAADGSVTYDAVANAVKGRV